jgi:hypothetical protein
MNKPIERLQQLNAQIYLLKSNLESFELLDEQEINTIIVSTILDEPLTDREAEK